MGLSDMDISDRSGNIVLDAHVWDDKSMWVVHWCHDSDIIELVSAIFEVVVFTFYIRVK